MLPILWEYLEGKIKTVLIFKLYQDKLHLQYNFEI